MWYKFTPVEMNAAVLPDGSENGQCEDCRKSAILAADWYGELPPENNAH